MKQLILIFFTLTTLLNVRGQSTDSINSGILNPAEKLEQLDVSEITSGNLINRSLVFSDHTRFYKDTADTNSYIGWLQLYYEIYNGYYDKDIIIDTDSIQSLVKIQKENNVIPIMVMDLEYHQIKDAAFVDSLIYEENGVYKDVLTRTESPYEIKRIISCTPVTNIIYKNSYSFLVSKSFFFTNQTNEPTSIEIDFGDGLGFRSIVFGEDVNINYSQVAAPIIKVVVTDNGNDLKAGAQLKRLNRLQIIAQIEMDGINGVIPKQEVYKSLEKLPQIR